MRLDPFSLVFQAIWDPRLKFPKVPGPIRKIPISNGGKNGSVLYA